MKEEVVYVMMRVDIERTERERLSPFAAKSADSKGRIHPLEPCDMRTAFQRDRDRVVHCKAFRRLKHKTQCFLSPEGDHYRTRLTHTIEVDQIARTIARALALNEDLTEAVALAHDLGHTPFGHMGERVLRRLSGHFVHSEQSLRVVDKLECLNLTYEVRDGILNHGFDCDTATLEGKVVAYADRIAYINHDIDDAMRAGVLASFDLPKDAREILGTSHGSRIDSMIRDLVKNSDDTGDIRMSPEMGAIMLKLRDFMFERVYMRPEAVAAEEKAGRLLEALYYFYMDSRDAMPPEYRAVWEAEGPAAAVCDYLASMTDRYAIAEFSRIFVPEPMV